GPVRARWRGRRSGGSRGGGPGPRRAGPRGGQAALDVAVSRLRDLLGARQCFAILVGADGQALVVADDATSWRVSGVGGAAEFLGLKPTTLEYRMKKLGIVHKR